MEHKASQKLSVWPLIITTGIVVGLFSYVVQSYKMGCGDWKDIKSCSITRK